MIGLNFSWKSLLSEGMVDVVKVNQLGGERNFAPSKCMILLFLF